MHAGDDASAREPILVGSMTIRYLVDGSATGGMGVFELAVPPDSNVPPPHSHRANEECLYVLEGVLRCSVDGVERDLRAGDWMRTPRGSVHQFSNPHREPARALIVLTPDIGAQYFRDVAAVVNAGGPPDGARLLDVMSRYGLVPAPAATGHDRRTKEADVAGEKNVLVIGLDPALIDFSRPGYAPGMTATKVLAGLQYSAEELTRLGYRAQMCLTDFGETAETVVRRHLEQQRYDCILIGAGVRTNPGNFTLFEKLINVVHEHAPRARICFNTMPDDTAAAIRRWV